MAEMTLEEKIAGFWNYIGIKVAEKDVHGVWDAAIEIAILEGRLKERSAHENAG
jgi:hypothetical protein